MDICTTCVELKGTGMTKEYKYKDRLHLIKGFSNVVHYFQLPNPTTDSMSQMLSLLDNIILEIGQIYIIADYTELIELTSPEIREMAYNFFISKKINHVCLVKGTNIKSNSAIKFGMARIKIASYSVHENFQSAMKKLEKFLVIDKKCKP